MRGRWVKLSILRRITTDLMYFSAGMPWIAAQREMVLRGLPAAREAHAERPSWTALFTKAYAMVAAEFPELRRAYVRLPWPHFYEYQSSVAIVAVERSYDGDIGAVPVYIPEPDRFALEHISAMIRGAKQDSFVESKRFRKIAGVARLPLPLRRLVWWLVVNLPRARATYFGTFGLSTVSALGTDILQFRTLVTTSVTYGVIGGDGKVVVRIVFDHRVLDAMTIARALARLEEILNGPIADELRGASKSRA